MNMKKYILSVLALVAICLSATAQTLTPVWKTTAIPVGSVWGGDARQGVGINGVFYINNAATESVEAYNQDGFISSTPTGYGWSITSDDAGNIISRAGTPGAGAAIKPDSIQINIIPAGGGSVIKVSLAGLQNMASARCDYFGHVYGDVVNGTGYLILSMNGESKLYAVAFDHGQVDVTKSFQLNTTEELMGFATQSTLSFSYVDKSGAQHATLMVRNGGKLQDLTLDMNNGVLGSNILDVKDVPVNRGADAGGEIFMLGDSLYAVYPLKDPTGSFNYLDGFQIANITSQEEGSVVVATVANTYQSEQNKGAGNWITVEHVNDTLVNLYNYYLNGFVAMYTFSIPGKPGVPNNALQLNFKDATDSVVVMLKDEPSYEFSTDGTQMTVYKGTTALGTAHSVSNVASLMYTFVDHKHTLTMVQDTVFPTDEATGTLAYWQCTGTEEDPGCMLYFADSLGTDTIGDATALAAWLAGEGMMPIAYNKEDRYVVVTTNDTMLVANTKYLSEVTNVTVEGNNSLLLIYREGTESVHASDTMAIAESELKSVEMKKGKELNKPVVPTSAPSALALYGTGAESDGQAFREVEEGVFVIYTRLTNGTLYFKGDGKTYFVDAEQGLLQGDGEGEATASANEHVSRITVNFNTLAVKVEAVRENVQLKFCADYRDLASLMYQGNGVYKAENVSIVFIDGNNPSTNPPGWLTWVEERYYFIVAIDTIETCWGAINDNTTNPNMDGKPNGNEHYYDINEFSWSQWDHTWKFDDSINGATIDIELRTNDNGEWKHIITVK